MLKRWIKKWGINAAAILIGCGAVFVALFSFNIATTRSTEQFIHQNLEEASNTAIASIHYSFKSFVEMLEQHAKVINSLTIPNPQVIINTLKSFSSDDRFERVTLITDDKRVFSSTYGAHSLPDNIVLPHLGEQATTISGPRITDEGELVIDISTSVLINNEYSGRLVATIGSTELKKMYTSNSLQGDASLTLISEDGTVITNIANRELPISPKSNIFEHVYDDNVSYIANTPEGMRNDIAAHRAGWIKLRHGGHSLCAYYQPFGMNNWSLLISATDNLLDAQVKDIRFSAIILAIAIFAIICAVSVVIFYQRVKELKRIDALMHTYSTAIRKTNDMFYEADIDKDILIDHSQSLDKAIWKQAPTSYSKALALLIDASTAEYKALLQDTFVAQNIRAKIKEGVSSFHLEYKVNTDKGTTRWMSTTLVPIIDKSTHSTKLICMENDITEQKLRHEQLRISATLDGLSGLYNKISAENYIKAYLSDKGADGSHALMLIDIDHFKSINDTLGHVNGDKVIVQLSNILHSVFRKNDILGRVGGDEFIVLLKNFGELSLVSARATEICNGFHNKFTQETAPFKEVIVSASIGIAIYSQDGTTFDELYKNADNALYTVKNSGKDGFAFYK